MSIENHGEEPLSTTRDCEHGQLARSCEVCERMSEINTLRARIAEGASSQRASAVPSLADMACPDCGHPYETHGEDEDGVGWCCWTPTARSRGRHCLCSTRPDTIEIHGLRSAISGNCENCDGRRCMACVVREVHDECVDDCPACCVIVTCPTDCRAPNGEKWSTITRWTTGDVTDVFYDWAPTCCPDCGAVLHSDSSTATPPGSRSGLSALLLAAGVAPDTGPARVGCGGCHRCLDGVTGTAGLPVSTLIMIVCPQCGNKRCPKATDHRLDCTGSNEPGQAGSVH